MRVEVQRVRRRAGPDSDAVARQRLDDVAVDRPRVEVAFHGAVGGVDEAVAGDDRNGRQLRRLRDGAAAAGDGDGDGGGGDRHGDRAGDVRVGDAGRLHDTAQRQLRRRGEAGVAVRDGGAGHAADDVRIGRDRGRLRVAEVPLDVRRRRAGDRGVEADRVAVERTGRAAGGTVRIGVADGALVRDRDRAGTGELVDVAEAVAGGDQV